MTDAPFAPLTTADLRSRFPVLRHVDGNTWEGQCPCDREHGSIEITETDDGLWTISSCLDGCSPRQIWEAAKHPAQPASSGGWGFRSATDFLAETFPPLRWLYLDLVPAESVTVVMAAPNAGKTFFGLDVVAQVAAKAAQQGLRVVIVEEEGTAIALQTRLRRALAAVGGADPSLIRVGWNTGRSLRNASDLHSLIEECKGSELVLLDSLSALAGGIDENSSKDMAEVAEALYRLRSDTGAAVMALHHMTKAAWAEGETPRLEHMRGHGALPGRADAVIALVPLEGDDSQVRFELHCVKQRDGSKPKARVCSVDMTGEAATMTMDDKEIPVSRAGRKPRLSYDDLKKRIVAYVDTARPLPSANKVLCDIGGNRTAALNAIRELLADHVLTQTGVGKYQRLAVLNQFGTEGTEGVDRLAVPGSTPKGVGNRGTVSLAVPVPESESEPEGIK